MNIKIKDKYSSGLASLTHPDAKTGACSGGKITQITGVPAGHQAETVRIWNTMVNVSNRQTVAFSEIAPGKILKQ